MSDAKRRPVQNLSRISLIAYGSLAAFSLIGIAIGVIFRLHIATEADIFGPITLIEGVVALFFQVEWPTSQFQPTQRVAQMAGLISFLSAGIFGAAAELIGVVLGFPFGKYRYTGLWFPSISLGIYGFYPLLIPLAWLLIPGGWALFASTKWKFGPAVLIAASGSALTDLLMEPVLVYKLHYWTWISKGPLPGGAPYANALGWWICSAIIAVILLQNRAKVQWTAILIPAIHLAMILCIGAMLPA